MAQIVLTRLCDELQQDSWGPALKMLSKIRTLCVRVADPPVVISIGRFRILAPLSHNLPVYRATMPAYSENLGDVAETLSRALNRPITMVDIGANIGDSAAIVRSRTDAAVLCIEGDPTFLKYLRANQGTIGELEIEPSYVNSADVDLAGGRVKRSDGTARIENAGAGGSDLVVGARVKPLAAILEAHPRFARPDLIKVDTDGHDLGILRAAEDLIESLSPVLFYEFDPYLIGIAGDSDPFAHFAELHALGYTNVLLYSNRGQIIGVFETDDPRLATLAAELRPEHTVAYWDIVAVMPSHHELLDALTVGAVDQPPTFGRSQS